ncbi:MAG: hypothetical protein HY773_02505 [Candidatus Terrybacteria bacterium]|nr:hypothetical protein [Candidatus Terrybacteria bacterium]
MKKIIILYMPVLHNGYLRFFKKHKDADTLYLVGEKLANEFSRFNKEIRQIDPKIIKNMIERVLPQKISIDVLNRRLIKNIKKDTLLIVTANDDVSSQVVNKYFPSSVIRVDSVFLRWDEKSVYSKKPVSPTRKSGNAFDCSIIKLLNEECLKSSDWWRQVGAAVIKDGKIILKGCNVHVPSEFTPYAFGDPRDFVEAGKDSHLTSALHAEQSLIAEAARRGIALEGTDIYVTVFPCPVCAKMIAYSGIKRVFFSSGHASLDGESILKAKGVELILVK